MTQPRTSNGARFLLFCLLALLAGQPALAKISLSGVTAVNITPSSFSIVGSSSLVLGSSTTISVSVFADSGGVTNLAGQVGLEFYPLLTGNPANTNLYERRLNEQALRRDSMNHGLVYARVSGCRPATTYYYQVQVADTNGQSGTWPTNGPLPSVTTPPENKFVLQSEQLIVNVGGPSPSGQIVLLSNTNTPTILAAVVGDGAGTNQAFFSINELLAAAGNTNALPSGTEVFTATVRGSPVGPVAQNYGLSFGSNFVISTTTQVPLGSFVALSLGSNAVLVGGSAAIPINLVAMTLVTNFSFVLNVPTNRFSNISVQPLISQLSSASLTTIGPDTLLLAFATSPGQNLLGNQDIALLNLATVSNQNSAFVPLRPQALQGTNSDASIVSQSAVAPGRLAIVGPQPLLETLLAQDGSRSLALYGHPGSSYQIQVASGLSGPNQWSDLIRVPLTNIMEVLTLDSAPSVALYRANSFLADPPLLDAFLNDPVRSLLAYGLPGTNYTLLSATNLGPGAVWSPVLSYTLTNSFQLLTNIANAQPRIFYRLHRP